MNSSKLSSRRRECGFTNDPIDSRFIDSSPADDCVLDCGVCSFGVFSFGANSLFDEFSFGIYSLFDVFSFDINSLFDVFSFGANSLFDGFSFGTNSLLSALNTRGDIFVASLRSSCVSEPVTDDRSEPTAANLTGDREDATDDASPSLSRSDFAASGITSCMMPRKLVDRFCASWKKWSSSSTRWASKKPPEAP